MKRHRFVRQSILGQLLIWLLIFQVMVFQCVPLFALPAGEQVTHGDVQFTRTPNHLQVHQATSKAVVNFHSFDIGVPETVQFIQPGANAAILNRVTGGMSSEIAGALLANGNVYLINPNGILFSQSARVDVGGLVASGLQMADSDFLSGRLFFSGGSGSVINEGSLTGDRIYLIGGTVENRGSISGPDVVLAAGRKSVLLDRAAGGEIRLVIDDEEVAVGEEGVAEALQGDSAEAGASDESAEEAASETSQLVDAVAEATTTETVLDNIAAAAEAAEAIVPTIGLDVIAPLESEFELGTIVNEGIVDASGEISGSISIRGIDVAQMGELHADGSSGSGGSITILAEDVLVLGADSETTVNAGVHGDGGSIVAVSENTTHFMKGSRVEMKGGSESGDGGYAEISGHKNLSFGGSVDASAPNGELGTVYFDPCTLLIIDADETTGDQDVNLPQILAGTPDTAMNTVSWGGIEDLGSAAIVELEASGAVIVDDVIGTASNTMPNLVSLSIASGSLTIRSTSDSVIFLDPSDTIRTEGGSITIEAGLDVFAGNFDTTGAGGNAAGDVALTASAGTLVVGSSTTGGGFIRADAGGDVFVLGALSTGGGDATVTAGLGIDFDNVVDTGGGKLTATATAGNIEAESVTSVGSGGDIDFDAGGTLTVNGTTDTGGGNLAADAGGDITFVGAVNANAGTVAATSTGGDVEFQDTLTTVAGNIGVTSSVGSIVFSQMVASAGGFISADAGVDVDLLQSVTTVGGHFIATAGNDVNIGGTINTIGSGGSVTLISDSDNDASGDVNLNGAVSTGGGSLTATGENFDNTGGTINTGTGATGTGGVISIVFDDTVNVAANLQSGDTGVNGASVTVIASNDSAAGGLTVAADISSEDGSAGTITIRGGTSIAAAVSLAAGEGHIFLDGTADDLVINNALMTDDSTFLEANRDVIINAAVSTGSGADLTIESDLDNDAHGGTLVQNAGSATSAGFLVILGSSIADAGGGGNAVRLATAANTVSADGNVLILGKAGSAANSHIDLNAEVSSTGAGSVSVLSAHGVNQNANMSTASGTIDVEADNGDITMGAGTVSTSGGGNIRYAATGNTTLGFLNTGTGTGDASVSAGTSILDANGLGINIAAASARLQAESAIGDLTTSDAIEMSVNTVAAQAGAGGMSLEDVDALEVGTVGPVSVNRVAAGGSASNITDGALAGLGTINGSIVTKTVNGTLTITEEVNAFTSGNILLQSQGSGDVAVNGTVFATAGSIEVNSAGAVQQTADITAGGTLRVIASAGDITMSDGAAGVSLGNNIEYNASGNLNISSIDAGAGSVYLNAGQSIIDAGETDVDVVGAALNANAGGSIGSTSNKLDTQVATLAANATQDIFIENTGAVAVDTVGVIAVNPVGMDGMTTVVNHGPASDLTGANIVLVANNGTITINDGVDTDGVGVDAAGAGNVLLQTMTAGDIALNAAVQSGSGNISFVAEDNVNQDANVTTGGGDIDIVSMSGGINTSGGGVSSLSNNGNITLMAANDITIDYLDAGAGMVGIESTSGSIRDAGDDAGIDVTALSAALIAGGSIGSFATSEHIETDVANIGARAGSGIGITEADDVTIAAISVPVTRVAMDGTSSSTTSKDATGVTTTNAGSIVVVASAGSINVNEAVSASGAGNIRIDAEGAGTSDLNLAANVGSGSGKISLVADRSVLQTAGSVSTARGTVQMVANNGETSQTDGVTVSSGGGNISIQAAQSVQVANVDAGAGQVFVESLTGSVVDNGDTDTDIAAAGLSIQAPSGTIGSTTHKLDTAVSTLAAMSDNGIFIGNTGAVSIDDVAQFTVNQVNADGTASPTAIGAQSDLITTGNGPIILVSTDTITVNDGSNPGDTTGVNAGGAGNVLLMTMGGGDVALNAGAVSGTGNISIRGAGNVTQGVDGDLTTGGTGTIDVEAMTGPVTMSTGAVASTGIGNIKYFGANDVTLGQLNAGAGHVSVNAAAGSILDAGDDAGTEIIGTTARLEAGNSIGADGGAGASAFIETDIDVLGALAGSGGIFVQDVDALEIGTVGPIAANRVAMDGTTSMVSHPALIGAVSTGEIDVRTVDGNLTITDVVSGNKVFLEAGGTERDLIVNTTVTATGSNTALKASQDVLVNTDVTGFQDVALWADSNGDTNGSVVQSIGTIEAQNGDLFIAGAEITQTGPSILRAMNGTVVLNAENDLNLGSTVNGIEAKNIVAGAANIFVDTVITGLEAVVLQATGGSIVHTSPGSGQIRGQTLGLVASGNIGASEANPLQVASQFLGSFAELDEFVVEEDSTSAGLFFNPGFYPDQGPDCAMDIPRPLDNEQDVFDLLEELIQAEGFLNIVVPGDLIGGILLAGMNATLDVGGSVDLEQIKVGGLLIADIGNNFIVDVLMTDSLILKVGGFANVGQLMVDTVAKVDINLSHTGGSMTIGGPLTMDVGGNWGYNSVSLGAPTDNVNVGANVEIGSLNESGSLNLNVGGSGDVGTFGVGGDLNANFSGSFGGGSLNVGGLTDLDVGTDMDYGSATFGGDADLLIGGNANVGALQANQNLLAMVGGSFAGNSFGVGNEAVLDIGGDWDYETGEVGGLVTAMVGGETRFGELTAGDLELITGSADFEALIVNNDADIESLGNMNANILDIGGEARFDIGGAFTFDDFEAGNIDVDAGRINMGRVRTGSARFAGSSIVDNGSMVIANSVFLTAGGDIGSAGSPIQLDVAMIDLISGGGDVTIVQNKAGETPSGLLKAGGALDVSVPNGGLVDKNGPDLNLVSGGDTRLDGFFFGTVSDALEVDVGGNIFMDGPGRDGNFENPGQIFGNFDGIVVGGIPKITYGGDVRIPGLVLLNGQLLLGSQAILIEVARTEAFVVETPEIKSPQGVFGDPYFIHLYMQISEAWNLFLDFILFGEADVTADPEMPEEAKRTIKIGGTEKPYAR